MTTILITPLDPVIARDGRPFNAGTRMKGLDWPYPSVLAGSLRTLVGKLEGKGFPPETVRALKDVEVAGPLPIQGGDLYFPAAADLVLDATRVPHAARPSASANTDHDLPGGLRPAMMPADLGDDFKPSTPPPFWSCGRMTEWLVNPQRFPVPVPPESPESGFLSGPQRDERTQTAIDPASGVAKDALLFQTVALAFPDGLAMAARVRAEGALASHLERLHAIHPIGGERRLALWQDADPPPLPAPSGKHKKKSVAPARRPSADPWRCPDAVRQVLSQNPLRVRMVLATPALFEGGWKPSWIRDGRPPGLDPRDDVTLTLISVCVPRWRPISGWNFEVGRMRPKAARRLAPAGSVYFFEARGATSALARLWLEPVSDLPQDRNDGFGLALWGVWSE
jgi:CRISPR-associated protein Cmr3